MTERHDEDRLREADHIAEACCAFLMAMVGPGGKPLDLVLAAAHAQVTALMVLQLGGEGTARALRQAATEIEDQPSLGAFALAMLPPSGRA